MLILYKTVYVWFNLCVYLHCLKCHNEHFHSSTGCIQAMGLSGLEVTFHSNNVASYISEVKAYWKGLAVQNQGMSFDVMSSSLRISRHKFNWWFENMFVVQCREIVIVCLHLFVVRRVCKCQKEHFTSLFRDI